MKVFLNPGHTPGDAALLRDKQDDFAQAIACGITDYQQS